MSAHEMQQFDEDGYLLLRDIFTPLQARGLREFFLAKFNLPPEQRLPGDTDSSQWDILSRYPEVRWLLFNERTLSALKMLAGDDFVILPDCFAALNSFVQWHKDTTASERRGQKIQWEKGYRMIAFLYYLQDNTEEYGGGLEVEPGSHLKPDPFIVRKPAWSQRPLRAKIGSKIKAIWYKATGRKPNTGFRPPNTVFIPSKAGDLVLCHFLLNHRARQPRKFPLPPEHEKIVIQGGISSNNRRFIQARLDFYHNRSGCFYPEGLCYPADLVKEAEAHGISFCTDDKGRD
jgi:hypothetical protein